MNFTRAILAALLVLASSAAAEAPSWLSTGTFRWRCSPPLIAALPGGDDPDVALKDPSLVYTDGLWHLFATHRRASGRVDMQYLQFRDWAEAAKATRHTLPLHDQYHCAPQVFYFTPHRKWYLIYQLGDKAHPVPLRPAFSTTGTLADPTSWTRPQLMIESLPEAEAKVHCIDFWVICDARKAHLFYTSDDGRFWRRETPKERFPFGWSAPELVLKDKREALFEASHTYKLRGLDRYLTILEALGPQCRYYKAWLAKTLEGPWKPLATSLDQPFAGQVNVSQPAPAWTTSFSHGELIRSGVDETLEVDPAQLRFVFQGVSADAYPRSKYGSIPWKIGILDLIDWTSDR